MVYRVEPRPSDYLRPCGGRRYGDADPGRTRCGGLEALCQLTVRQPPLRRCRTAKRADRLVQVRRLGLGPLIDGRDADVGRGFRRKALKRPESPTADVS